MKRTAAVTPETPQGTCVKVLGTRLQGGFVGRVQRVFEHDGVLMVELYHMTRGGMYFVAAERCRSLR